jgi:hypothetical protein
MIERDIGTMTDNEDKLPLTRRDCLKGGAVVLAATAQPAMAQLLSEKPLRAPPGQRRDSPGFLRLHLDK